MSGYVRTFNVKDDDKDKKNKFMSFHVDLDHLELFGLRLKACKILN